MQIVFDQEDIKKILVAKVKMDLNLEVDVEEITCEGSLYHMVIENIPLKYKPKL